MSLTRRTESPVSWAASVAVRSIANAQIRRRKTFSLIREWTSYLFLTVYIGPVLLY